MWRCRITVNLIDSNNNILQHVDFRMNFGGNTNTIATDSYINGWWGGTRRTYPNPFPMTAGEMFDVKIVVVTLDAVQVSV